MVLGAANAQIPNLTLVGSPGEAAPIDALVQKYKRKQSEDNHHDYDRKEFLRRISWDASNISGTGKLRVTVDYTGTGLIKLYTSTSKTEKPIAIPDLISVDSSSGIFDFHVEGERDSSPNQSEDVKLTLTYEPSDPDASNVSKEYKLKVFDLEVVQVSQWTGFDDNSEEYGGFPFPGLMVPLAGADGTNGSNSFKVVTKPADLASKFKPVLVFQAAGNISVNHSGPLSSGSQTITVSGTKHVTKTVVEAETGPRVEIVTSSDQKLVASLFVDVKERYNAPYKYDILKMRDNTDNGWPTGFTAAEIENNSNNVIWGPQANVFIDVVNEINVPIYNWDLDGDGLDRNPDTEILAVIQGGANSATLNHHEIYIVDKFISSDLALAFWSFESQTNPLRGFMLVDDSRKKLLVVAHELGHSFKLNGTYGLGGHSDNDTDVMGDYNPNTAVNKGQVRRIDWNTANK